MQRLEGIHHITAITADAPGNVDFYARALGLRLIKKTVNFDAPDVYHLYYGDERGSPGSILTFFEFPGVARGRPGAGMVYHLAWRVGSPEALDFWAGRLEREGIAVASRDDRLLVFHDPEGLELALLVDEAGEPPLRAEAADLPAEHALLGFAGVHAYAAERERSVPLFEEALGFERVADDRWRVAGAERSALYVADPAPSAPGIQGAGTVHHIAWSSKDDAEQEEWRARVSAAGARPTPIIDRQYFHSVYFREPNGVLFELATRGPGFDIDEPLEHLGESLRLPPQHEHLREALERTLTPLPPSPRASRTPAS
jgi:glyoxalase family protein